MNKEQVKRLLAAAIANFPNMQERDMKPTLILWEKMLADIPYEVAEKALMKVLATSKFFPTVADIREAATTITAPQLPTAAEAWGEVIKAVRRYGTYQENEAMESLPLPVAQVVRWIGWREICLSEEPEVVRAQFMRMYDTQVKRERENAQMPADVRQLIGQVGKPLLS